MSERCIDAYATLVFDCDGVVLDSNKVKTEAFYQAALPYGAAAAAALVDYHVRHGGVSRYQKFAMFLDELVPKHAAGPGRDELLAAYAADVYRGLMNCAVAAGLERLRRRTPAARWLIVSGGDQAELREVFARRGLAPLFDGGIFGSPDTKDEILARELARGTIVQPALFLGDSRYDYLAARRAGLDFTFISQWSEFEGWQDYAAEQGFKTVATLASLL